MRQVVINAIACAAAASMLIAGCTTATQGTNSVTSVPSGASTAYRIESTTYDGNRATVAVHIVPNRGDTNHPNLVEVRGNEGLINYATTKFPTQVVKHVTVISDRAAAAGLAAGTRSVSRTIAVPHNISAPAPPDYAGSSAATVSVPPRGARMDRSIPADCGAPFESGSKDPSCAVRSRR